MMKATTSFALIAALTAFGCSKKKEEGTTQKSDPAMTPKTTEPPAEPPKPEPLTGTALADKYKSCIGMLNDGKLDDFRKECVADDYVGHPVGGMPERKGADSMMAMLKDERVAMPDIKIQPQIIMVSGRNILAVNLVMGTQSGPMKTPMGEMPASNKKMGMLMFHHLAINDANKASEEWAYMNAGAMMSQLGMAPKDAPPARPAMEQGMEGAPVVVVTADNDQEKANLETVKKGNDAFVANKPADVMATMSDDTVETTMGSEKDTTGKKAIEKGLKEFLGAWSDMKMSDVNMWAADDYVVQTFKFEGKNDKPMGKMKKTDKQVSLDVAEVMHFKDGKIDHTWRFMNELDFMAQLGMMPAPGAPAGGDAKHGATK